MTGRERSRARNIGKTSWTLPPARYPDTEAKASSRCRISLVRIRSICRICAFLEEDTTVSLHHGRLLGSFVSGLVRIPRCWACGNIDAAFEDFGGLERQHPTRRNHYFLTGLRIAPHSFCSLANDKEAEGRQFHCLASLKAVADLLEHQFNQLRRLCA
jgi:hypothetical protein